MEVSADFGYLRPLKEFLSLVARARITYPVDILSVNVRQNL